VDPSHSKRSIGRNHFFCIVQLNKRADENRQVTAQLAQMEADARHMSASEWQVIAERDENSKEIKELGEAQVQLLAEIFALRTQHPGNQALESFYQSYKEYSTALAEEVRLLQSGDFSQARKLDVEKVDPRFDQLMDALNRARTDFERLAQQGVRRTQIGMFIVVFGSIAAFAGLVARQRKRLAMVEQHTLRDSEERFRALTENSTDLIAILGVDQRLSYVSPSAARTLGYDSTSLVGSKVLDLVHPEDANAVSAWLRSSQSTAKPESMEFRLHSHGGEWVWMESDVRNLLSDPKVQGLVLNARDVSERKRFTDELAESEQRFKLIAAASSDIFWDWDLVTNKVWWNDNLYKSFGYALEEIKPDIESWTSRIHPEDAERVEQAISNVIKSGTVSYADEYRFRRGDGSYADILDRGEVLRDHSGKAVRMVGVMMDISRRKRTEQELQQSKEAAEAASRSKSEFLANMSHEIRTPLNGVMGMTDLALETELTSEQREYLETVKLSADSLLTVINDILDFSKMEAGKIELEVLDFNLRDCVETTLKTLALRADEKNLELMCEVAPEIPELVRGDSNRLRQVILNLVGNAIKFTSAGEVSLKVHADAGGEGKNRMLHFTVSDTGIGISSEKLQLIFEPFTQADTSTTRKYGGTGLGLTISSRLVEMMGGKIWVESEVDRGTQFHFTALVEVADPKPIEVGTIAPPEILRDVRVLVVDDNRTNRRILEGMLKLWEMKPASVESGEEALAELATAHEAGERYGLILTDMHMPGMDGFTLVERIRQKPELTAATIMMLTSAGHRGDAMRCQELGVAAYLLKPIRQSELREAIARSLGAAEEKGTIPLITRFSLQDARDPASVLRVLLAEDNLVNQRLVTRLLEKRGHRVVISANGHEALLALEKETFDLVFMDLQMPEMDGFEATAAIRQKEKGTNIHQPVIALTAHAMTGDRERCLAGGMDGYLSKPIRPMELDNLLQKYVDRRMSAAAGS
jgi:PAS domain S-box-containing protein